MTRQEPGGLVVVLDLGKSNAKLTVLDRATGRECASLRRPTAPTDGMPRELGLPAIEAWIVSSLASLPGREQIEAIVPVAHGAACVMLDHEGRVLLAPDYEDPVFDSEAHAYAARRDPFALTFSPLLPLGLNLGRQLHTVATRLPGLFGQVSMIMPLAQYVAWFLSGVAASEVTSLACHTDLWCPAQGCFSPLAESAGWSRLFPPLRAAGDRLGSLRPALADRCGLPPGCSVLCGIHDSNASWYRHRVARGPGARFSVISSGTWTIVLSSGTPPGALRPECDMLANVDATGALVGTARFMGGREYEAVAGSQAPPPDRAGLGHAALARAALDRAALDRAALDRALACGARVDPCFAPGGQFPGAKGRVVGGDALDPAARAALASLYVALLASHALDLLRAEGDIVIDGPLARNPLFASLLATLRAGAPVLLGGEGSGSAGGAYALLTGRLPDDAGLAPVAALGDAPAIREQARRWGIA